MDSVNIDNNAIPISSKKGGMAAIKRKKMLFFFLMALPFIIQTSIFYIYVNASTISLAFMEYGGESGLVSEQSFVWFKNFGVVLRTIFAKENVSMFLVSFLMYAFVLCIITPTIILFSFYVYKKFFMSEFFRVILFLPQIIASVMYVSLYKIMLGPMYTQLTGNLDLLQSSDTTIMLAIIFYTFWTGFGTNILLMSGAMSGIDDSVVEACYLDGCNMTKEFVYVTLPSIYPTLTTFIVLDFTGIFSNSLHLYTFFGQKAPIKSVGYFMEIHLLKSSGLYKTEGSEWFSYPELAAMGLMITIIVSPIAIYLRRILEKIGPSED